MNIQDYRIEKVLGTGGYSRVLAAIDPSGERVTVKETHKENSKGKRCLQREIIAARKVQHWGIPKLLEILHDETNTYLVYQHIPGIDLVEYMTCNHFQPLEETRVWKIFHQLLNTIKYCHSIGIYHRDIKLDNIILSEEDKVFLIDFGLCGISKEGGIQFTEIVGSSDYCAPEILRAKIPYNGEGADVFSLGVVLYSLVYGMMPFRGSERKKFAQGIGQHPKLRLPVGANSVSLPLQGLIQDMLILDPSQRISISGIFEHSWMYAESRG